VLWRAAVGLGYSGPAVAGGRVFVFDYVPAGEGAFENDYSRRSKLDGKERLLCLDAKTGKEVWRHEYPCPYDISYPAGPRCTPTVHAGKVYALGATGHLKCLSADDGKILWEHDLRAEYKAEVPIWGFCAHPLFDGDRLVTCVGGPGSVAVAFHKDTGKEIWRALSAREPGYCPPTLIEHGGRRQLLIWHAEALASLDPATGEAFWSVPLDPNYGMSIMAPRQSGDLVYVGGIVHKGMAVRLGVKDGKPTAEVAWRGEPKNGLYSKISTPLAEDGHLYGVCQDGELRCVRVSDGARLWQSFAATTGKGRANSGGAFLVRHKPTGRTFILSETGDLVIAKLSPAGYEELSRTHLIDPTNSTFGRKVVWSHPAFADRCVFARNDREIVCASLSAE
jgi:outer membrane protein assembly factor BamB